MGLIANYFIVDDLTLKNLQNANENALLDKIEELEDTLEDICDIDKIWNGLYFLISLNIEPVYDTENFSDYSKSVFIFGDEDFQTEDYIAYTKIGTIKEIYKEIEKINFKDLVFKPEDFIKNEIYPDIWSEDKNLLLEEMEMAFDELKVLYAKALKQNKNILVTIY